MDMGSDPSSPLYNLSISDPNCVNESCKAFLDAENESQASVSWAGQFEYGHWLTYFYVIILGLFMIKHIIRSVRDSKATPPASNTSVSVSQKAVAQWRSISYRRPTTKPLALLGLPSSGMLVLLLISCAFTMALTFAVKPYYREHLGYGSPPIAIRCGLMAFACTPILVALAGKANIVTLLTGVSHEKLNVIHQWVAWISFVLSMIHAFPYFMQSAWDASLYHVSAAENVKTQFYVYGTGGCNEYSGVPPLAILFGLCIFSLPYVRNRFYESFYYTHILLGVTYLGLLFWHADNTLDSWSYLWATLALWLASYVARIFLKTRPLNIHNQWLVGSPTTLEDLPGDVTRVEVLAPAGFQWSPSQHCFLRVPSISLLDNHPFTIMSTSRLMLSEKRAQGYRDTLIFLVRAHSGFTKALADYSKGRTDRLSSVWVDGPYGGINRPIERLFDTAILVAGGSGISACLPWLLHLVQASANATSAQALRIKRVVLIWAIRDPLHFSWIERDLKLITSTSSDSLSIDLKFHITQSTVSSKASSKIINEKEISVAEVPASVGSTQLSRIENAGEVVQGRPVMSDLLDEYVGEGSTVVFGCGPEGFRLDLANACANAQRKVGRGGVQGVEMHLEAFGW